MAILDLMKAGRTAWLSPFLMRTFIRKHSYEHYLIVDFEATCLFKEKIVPQEIIEFPCLKVGSRTLTIESVFHHYVKPLHHQELSQFCTQLTGIVQDMVDDQLDFAQCFSQFESWLREESLWNRRDWLFVTYGDWDLRKMLPTQCKLSSIRLPDYATRWANLQKVYAHQSGKFIQKMPAMLDELGLPLHGRHHSGIDDCINIANILKSLVGKGCDILPTSDFSNTATT